MDQPDHVSTLVAQFRHSDLPWDATIAVYFAEPGRAIPAAHEIQRIQRGEISPIRADIDPLTAFVVICYLESVLRRDASAEGIDRTVRRFIEDLESALGRECPELVAVLVRGRATQPPEKPPMLALPAPPPKRPLAHRLVFDFAGPGTWEEWDGCFHYRRDLQHLVRRMEAILAQEGKGGAI